MNTAGRASVVCSASLLILLSMCVGGCDRQRQIAKTNQTRTSGPAAEARIQDHRPNYERLKTLTSDSSPIDDAKTGHLIVTGLWRPVPNDAGHALVYPEQVRITCEKWEGKCREYGVTLGVIGGMIVVNEIDSPKEWAVVEWTETGLTAHYGPSSFSGASLSERCRAHLLQMNFATGEVVTTDSKTATNDPKCSVLSSADTYELKRGTYYLDTSLDNSGSFH